MKHKIMIIMAFTMMGIIFLFSSCNANMSSMQSDMIVKLINNVIPINSFFVRKLAHFSLFFILELILFLTLKNIYLSFFISSGYALLDEFHQYFVPGRSCELRDVLIDISGCMLAILIIKLWRYYHAKRTTINGKNN